MNAHATAASSSAIDDQRQSDLEVTMLRLVVASKPADESTMTYAQRQMYGYAVERLSEIEIAPTAPPIIDEETTEVIRRRIAEIRDAIGCGNLDDQVSFHNDNGDSEDDIKGFCRDVVTAVESLADGPVEEIATNLQHLRDEASYLNRIDDLEVDLGELPERRDRIFNALVALSEIGF